ncbi:rho GTPase-activating protein 8 isoform X4 [Paramormyrops kingsleyae]|uniref:rho GTPase-activating protein 8 isoform X4 n=1 Tax=Paramormyrops kingsleyae TaxID=1676925 RepID=UPI003B9711BA
MILRCVTEWPRVVSTIKKVAYQSFIFADNMNLAVDLEQLAEIELQKDEAEQEQPEGRSLAPPGVPSSQDTSHPYYDVARHGILQVTGDDNYGRKLIIFSCCCMPPSHQLNHQRLLEYLKYTLDQYVESDYTIVYFHYGLRSTNKPSLRWLSNAYKEFDRKYKKNLKALYVVHPTNFIRVLWNIFKPVISHKFGKKLTYVNYLAELREHLNYDQLIIPPDVLRHDEKLRVAQKGGLPPPMKVPPPRPPLPTQQFGVSLQYIREKNQDMIIPLVISETVAYLKEKGLRTEGVFRRSARVQHIKEVQKLYNLGIESSLRVTTCKRMVEHLPEHNFLVLKYLICFLHMVSQESIINKMSPSNLACVFGVNLIWPNHGSVSLGALTPINIFTELIIEHYPKVFSSRSTAQQLLP